jgi:Sec-independent protein secretion pathway component TatC
MGGLRNIRNISSNYYYGLPLLPFIGAVFGHFRGVPLLFRFGLFCWNKSP